MANEFHFAVYESLSLELDPAFHTVDNIFKAAQWNEEITILLPFYMYCFHPTVWQIYSKCSDYYYVHHLNAAMTAALELFSMETDQEMKDFFIKASANQAAADPGNLSVSLRAAALWYKHQSLQKRAAFLTSNRPINENVYYQVINKMIKQNNKNLV
ncbi:hypothetical protein [Sinobaca sp. H24]|uniref:hypothetical protein n=1 Tax=Sinobaca sp. H24 TaxID=2923376 RepID=UPI002079B74D|nr:hypothetical protein [Sinobaca sp. H24]